MSASRQNTTCICLEDCIIKRTYSNRDTLKKAKAIMTESRTTVINGKTDALKVLTLMSKGEAI